MMMGMRELGIHIGWQYTNVNGIWQVSIQGNRNIFLENQKEGFFITAAAFFGLSITLILRLMLGSAIPADWPSTLFNLKGAHFVANTRSGSGVPTRGVSLREPSQRLFGQLQFVRINLARRSKSKGTQNAQSYSLRPR
jgi:hypothetical protein